MASGDPKRILPLVARTFADMGYRQATTAALAKRCGVRENVLYRLWPSKKEMFLATIDYLWQNAMEIWQELIDKSKATGADAARLILDYESKHHGETGLYKVIFAGLTESNDPQIAAALRQMYCKFHAFIAGQVAIIRKESPSDDSSSYPSDELTAWGLLGVSMVSNVDRELKLFGVRERALLFTQLANQLITPPAAQKSKG
ncbi:MAG TPA: TetR/AcrR family transcriptional regulator [Tepidisphaeraceae bacterium]|nr:TetR/AcrR family transcriptional regulator [Tepidisphaeraceae bacterium]